MRLFPLLPLLVTLAPAPPAQGFAHNKIEFNNWWLDAREDTFPNYTSAGGNLAGDGLFKVFPGEIAERGENHRLSGYQLALSIDDGYTGPFPVQVEVPAVQLYRTRELVLGSATYEVPDPAQPVGPRFDPIPVTIPSDNAWVIEVRFHPSNANPHTRALLDLAPLVGPGRRGLAMMALGKAGDRRAPGVPGVVLQSSFGERHLAPGRASHSGSFAAAGSVIRMFGTAGMPSATGELYFGLRFQNPTLQLAGPSAGGVLADPQRFETQLGPGAYATDLATRLGAGHVRFFVQGEQYDPLGGAPTHLAFPFVVAFGTAGPTATTLVGGAPLRLDPAIGGLATLLVDAGFAGPLVRIAPASGAGFDEEQRGSWSSAPLPVPLNRSLNGTTLWIQALVTTTSMLPVASTNAVRLSL